LAYAGRSRGIAVEVFAANDANPAKVDRMRSLGARVTLAGADFDAAKQNARQYAAGHPDCLFVEDGADDAITEGAGTIALEVVAAGAIDAVVVPLGDGALITGIAAWMKFRSPRTRIIGVCPTGTPAMLHAWRNARGVPTVSRDMRNLKSSDVTHTIADGIAVTAPVPKAVEKIKDLVDDIVLVDDHSLIEAMRLSAFTLGLILEPAGAAGLAAIRVHEIPGERIATILTGSNLHPEMLGRIVDSAH
jgi:threonine dehydratase